MLGPTITPTITRPASAWRTRRLVLLTALVAALRLARESGAHTVVTVFPDGGDRYLSDRFWEAGTGD